MPFLKQVERSATGAFCPHVPYLAAGTVAGAVDLSFSTSSVLEIFTLDFSSSAEALPVCGSVPVPERFNRLAWGPHVATDPAFPQLGLLAGGLADGSVCLWDPAAIINPKAKEQHRVPMLAKMQKHTGGVKGLEFNTFSPNLLASGAADSDLCIWDLAKPVAPSLYPALKGGAGAPGAPSGGETTYIAWNRKVQHILASCSTNGSTVVWDLKRQKPVISFRDPNAQRRASVIQWNPDIATQLIVASDDDRMPTLQMWDLRNSVSPLKEFVGHTKGVLGMAWSMHDSSLLLSSGKDNRTICWDVHTGEVVGELATSNWNFDVQWSPITPGIFSTASFDGKLGVVNLLACTGSKVTEVVNADFSVTQSIVGDATPLRKAPAWLRRPCGATFGFGGRLVSFTHHKAQVTDAATGQPKVVDTAQISLRQVITESELVSRSETFEHAIQGGNATTLRDYCASKLSQLAEGPGANQDAETWQFLSVLFEGDNARRVLLNTLGFKDLPEKVVPGATENGVADGVVTAMEQLQIPDGGADANAHGSTLASPQVLMAQDDPDFFDKLPDEEPVAPEPPAAAVHEPSNAEGADHASSNHAPAPGHVAGELEEEVFKALTIGAYATAVDHCLAAHRYADALLIANTASKDLYQRTMHKYMQLCPHPYQSIILANLEGDYSALIRTRPVGAWRETLAMLVTYTDREKFRGLADQLAARLATAGMAHEASLCWVCGGHTDQAVAYWARNCSSGATSVDVLQSVIEKAVIMGMAPGVSASSSSDGGGVNKASHSLSELVTSYASLLAANGRMTMALDYLEHVPGEASTAVAVLKDRIYRSGGSETAKVMHPPPFPFVREEVAEVAASSQPAAAAAHGYAGYGQQQQQAYAATAQAAQTAQASHAYAGYGQQQQPAAQQQAYGQQQPAAQQQAYGQQQQASAPSYPAQASSVYGQQTATSYGQQYAAAASPQYAAAPQQYNTAPAAAQPAATAYGNTAAAQYSAQSQANAYGNYSQYQPQQPASSYAASGYGNATAAQQYQPASTPYAQPADAGYNARKPTPAATTTAQPAMFTPMVSANPPAAPQPPASAVPPAAPPPPAAAVPTAFVPNQLAQTAPASQAAVSAQQAHFFVPSASSIGLQNSGSFGGQAGAAATAGAGAAQGMPGAGAAPASQKPAAPAPPPGPPANISVATADTSNASAELRPAVASLTNLYNSCLPLANNPAKKREMDDNTKKIGQLFWKLNAGEVSAGVLPKLLQLCAAIDANDWQTANHIQVQMTTTDWDECGFWLSAVKRLIKLRMV